jgi:ubiquinone/menaquinone biosynthesis C-methylase UbiE
MARDGMSSPEQDPRNLPLGQRYLDERVVERYDRARYEGPIQGLKGRMWRRLVTGSLRHVAGARSIMDIPCGTGYLTELLPGRFPVVIAADISPAMVRKTLSRLPVQGLVADLLHLPCADGSVDCVLNARFMVHFGHEERKRYLMELARVSARHVLVNYNHRYTLKYLLRRLRVARGRLGEQMVSRKCSRSELRAEAEAAGLRIVRIFRELPLAPFLTERWMVLFEKTAPRAR